ncbi:hypothetical protein ACU4GD_39635 [Cupriavidus basilensis]
MDVNIGGETAASGEKYRVQRRPAASSPKQRPISSWPAPWANLSVNAPIGLEQRQQSWRWPGWRCQRERSAERAPASTPAWP